MFTKMIEGGFKSNKVFLLTNFINAKRLCALTPIERNHYCYVGRLSDEKGVYNLLNTAEELSEYNLKVIGTGPLEKDLLSRYRRKNIEFLGFRSWDYLKEVLSTSKCMIIPSKWYENSPLSIIESL